MDAGARGRRLLQRREYKAKVSEFIPKELEDHVVYENDALINTINKASKFMQTSKNPIVRGLRKVFKSDGGKNYPTQQQYKNSVQQNSYEPEGEMIEANSEQMKAMQNAKLKKMEDDKVAEKKKKKVDEACWKGYEKKGMKTMFGKRYPNCVKKTKKEEVEVAEDMKGMSQKSGDKRSTESGAGMTAKGVAKYNRRTGGNLKTAVTTPPSKLKAGSKAAKRRKSFCARSKSWTGPRGKAARRRWNCSYEPELPMIIDEKKKLFNTAPLSNRVSNWSKKVNEGDTYVKSNRNPLTGLPNLGKGDKKKSSETKTTGVNYGAMAQSYEPQGEVIQEMPTDIKNVVKGGLGSARDQFLDKGKVDVKGTLKNTLRNALQTKTVTDFLKKDHYEPQGELVEMGRKGKGAINSDVLKNNPNLDPLKPGDYIKLKRLSAKVDKINERKMTSSEKDKKEKYVKGMKKVKGDFTKRYGKDGKSVMYATATKMAMKEESCGKGEYYCYDDKKCKPIPDGYKEGKDGMLVKEAKVDKGKSDYAKQNERNQRTFGNRRGSRGSLASHEDTEARRYNTKKSRGVKMKGKKDKTPVNYHKKDSQARVDALLKSMKEDFYKKKYDVRKGGYQKTNKMTKSNKRSGDSKAQYRQVHKDLAKENALIDKIKNDFNIVKKAKDTVNKYNQKLKKNNDAINKVMPGSATLNNEGSLHKWFKGSKSKDGKPGWVNVVTGGTCASDKPGEGTPKCVSSSKRASMTKAERLSASRRKKKADPGQQSKSGAAKPTYVATDKKKK